jgi:uncharacterized HAD superfamily protein
MIHNKKTIISFDFDSTLTVPQFDEENEIFLPSTVANVQIVNLLKLLSLNHEIVITTSRSEKDRDEVLGFVKEQNLPVSKMFFTDGRPKVYTLRTLNVLMHFDDDVEEIMEIEKDKTCDTFLVESL